MIVKKWRPLWSYDVEKTERWLSEMAASGNRLVDMNRQSRKFVFEQAECDVVDYQIVFDKGQSKLPKVLVEAGWENKLAVGNWRFMENGREMIHMYPSRQGILKRNRLHGYVISALAILNAIPLFSMTMAFLSLLFGFPGEIVGSPLWVLTGLFAAQGIATIVLAFYLNGKLKSFERAHFEVKLDVGKEAGQTFVKRRFVWMYAPDLLEKWLSEMAARGNHLVRVTASGTRFHFVKGEAKKMVYVNDFQLKVSPAYYGIHKEAGWQLKFTSSSSPFMKHTLWAKSYGSEEGIPQLTYDKTEQKAQVRKILSMNSIYVVYMVALLSFIIWTNVTVFQGYERSLFDQILISLLIASLIVPIYITVRTILYYRRMRNV